MWHTKGRTARYVHLRIRAVLEWAIAMDWRTDNPCDRLLPVLGPQHDVVEYRKALPHREVVAAIERVRAADPAKVDALAFEFLVLTAARSGEVRGRCGARSTGKRASGRFPPAGLKTARAHRVPLCGRALEILDAARRLGGGGSPIVFVNERAKSLGSEQLTRLLRKHRIAAVPHGFRSSFRDWAGEKTDHPRGVVEAALAHVVQNKVEAAYMRSGPVRAPPSADGRVGGLRGRRQPRPEALTWGLTPNVALGHWYPTTRVFGSIKTGDHRPSTRIGLATPARGPTSHRGGQHSQR